MSVVGLAFSVILVALTLAAQQLSPRVLRTFRRERLNQATLAAFLATAVYALLVLRAVRTADVPDVSITLALVLVVTSIGLFVAFVHHIVLSLQPATVVHRVVDDGLELVRWYAENEEDAPHEPSGLVPVRASQAGFLQDVDVEEAAGALARAGAAASQRAAFGDYVVRGDVVAEVHAPPEQREAAVAATAAAFAVGEERAASLARPAGAHRRPGGRPPGPAARRGLRRRLGPASFCACRTPTSSSASRSPRRPPPSAPRWCPRPGGWPPGRRAERSSG